jgi:hypothetical protein
VGIRSQGLKNSIIEGCPLCKYLFFPLRNSGIERFLPRWHMSCKTVQLAKNTFMETQMKLRVLKPTLVAIGAGTLLIGCADDGGVGEGFEDETALEDEGAFGDPGADLGADIGVDNAVLVDEEVAEEGISDEGDESLGNPSIADEGIVDDTDLQLAAEDEDSVESAAAGGHPPFEEVDADSDGQITRTELAMVEGLDFTSLDVDDDSFLSREEYEAGD